MLTVPFTTFNNGITIIGTQAHIVGNAISIENAQIVNGLQTSESIFNHFSDVGQKDDKRSVLIKIIITNDLNVRNAIIYATNNQTNVNGRPPKRRTSMLLAVSKWRRLRNQ